MRILDSLERIAQFLIARFIDAVLFIVRLVKDIVIRVFEKFLDVNFFEKIVFINLIAALFAITLPVARFFMFETYYYVNNPLAIYMIGIGIFMFASMYFPGVRIMAARVIVNAWYLLWMLYLKMGDHLTKANPHEITSGYYVNLVVPAVFIVASVLGHLAGER